MFRTQSSRVLGLSVGVAIGLCMLPETSFSAVGDTRIAQWKGDKTATFLLMFDDSWPSHYQMAVPALAARNMTATFYVCPAKGEYQACKSYWEGSNAAWTKGMVYGNHTMTHDGITSATDAEYEIGGCTNSILSTTPGKPSRLISFAVPGGVPWNITSADYHALLDKYHLIERPTFDGHGAVYHWQTSAQMLALADSAIAKKGMEYLIIHGVERRSPWNWGYQDYWALNYDIFTSVLDGLKDRRDRGDLWITDHISYCQYKTERENASLSVLESTQNRIQLSLTSSVDSYYYDQPLTLVTSVPATWSDAWVTQNGVTTHVTASNGSLLFDAVPNGGTITVAVPEPTAITAGVLPVSMWLMRRSRRGH